MNPHETHQRINDTIRNINDNLDSIDNELTSMKFRIEILLIVGWFIITMTLILIGYHLSNKLDVLSSIVG